MEDIASFYSHDPFGNRIEFLSECNDK
jgi:hypothetical protein